MSRGELAVRLLELEQRFKSYCTLHEAEMVEIRAALDELRGDILSSTPGLRAATNPVCAQSADEGYNPEDGASTSSALAL